MFTSKKVRLNPLPEGSFALCDTPKVVSLIVMINSRIFSGYINCLI